jgi:5'-3' exonuclease
MGIKSLGQLLKERCTPETWGKLAELVALSRFAGHRVFIDLLNIFHPLVIVAYGILANEAPGSIPNHHDAVTVALGMYANVLNDFVVGGATPVTVADGQATRLKDETQKKRRKVTDKNAEQQVDAEIRIERIKTAHAAPKAEPKTEDERRQRAEESLVINSELADLNKRVVTAIKGSVRISQEDKDRVRELCEAMGTPFVQAPEEAEKYCAEAVKAGHGRAAYSNDTDMLVHGCPVVMTKLEHGAARVVFLCNILTQLELTMAQFVDFCVMCGTDYNENVPTFGPKRCLQLIRRYKSLDAMPDDADTSFIVSKNAKNGKAAPSLPRYRKALLHNKAEDKSWREIRAEFTEGGLPCLDASVFFVDECDLPRVRELIGKGSEALRGYAKAHSDLLSSDEYKLPFVEYDTL